MDQSTLPPALLALEPDDPAAVLSAALEHFGDRAVISTAFGVSGLCLLHMAQQIDPDVSAYYIDTDFAFDETNWLVERWTNERRLRLKRILPILTPSEQAEEHGERLWERDPDLCCKMRKVEPNLRALDGYDLWITSLRRDASRSRANTPLLDQVELANGKKIWKLCPMVEWTMKDVWRYVVKHDLPYNPLHDQGFPSVGCTHCTRAVADGEDERAGRWSGRNKTECGLHL